MLLRGHPAAGVLLAAAVTLGLFVPAVARAAETTLTFDDLAAGTTVSTQYSGRGATFGPIVSGQAQATRALPAVTSVGSTLAASGSQVGRVQRACLTTECVGTPETWAQFNASQARVRVSVGAFGTTSTTVTATGFNASGVQVAQSSASVTGGNGFRTQLSLSTTTAAIRFVRVRGSGLNTLGIDSVFFSDQPSTGPDFSISVPFGPHVVQQGASISIPVTITRRNSSGTIRISATGAPAQTTISPADSTLATAGSLASSTTVNLTFTAASSAPPASDATITVTATPQSKEAGLATQSLTARVRVLVLYDLRITGVEPTQGIQSPVFAIGSGAAFTYAGVPLQQRGRTIVRVYGNTGRGGFPVTGVVARLHGFDAAGQPLPGSPLFPDGGSRTVAFGLNAGPTFAERSTAASAWTYTLPASWSSGTAATRLRAEVSIPTSSIAFRECDGCTANNAWTLSGVSYTPTCCVVVDSAIITAQGGSTPRPISQIMAPGLNITPLQIDLRPYGTTLDVTEGIERNAEGRLVINRDQAVRKLLDFNQRDGGGDIVLGILSPEFSDGYGKYPYGVFDDLPDRPYTSSAHELGHALGRPHASPSCGGDGEDWQPDQTGLIRGFALDRTTSPYRVFATPAAIDGPPATLPASSGDQNAFYDLMSYCPGDFNAWISVKGWIDTISRWRDGVFHSAAAAAPAQPRLAAAAPRLQVNAAVGAGDAVTILGVRPLTPKPQAGLSATPYRLVVRDAAGAAIADVPMAGRTLHVDRGGRAPTTLEAAAPVDPAKARSVEITRGGAVVARRTRSAHAPTGRFLRPGKGVLVGRGDRLDIRWQAADADRDALDVTVEWSARGGRPGTWRSIFLGPNGGKVAVPSDYFAGSGNAFLRLRISDGFNETTVLSAPFRTIHRRPTVQIRAPRDGARVRADVPVVLSATARDETRTVLDGDRIRWYDGARRVARGGGVTVRGLRPGTHTLRAEATDARGRRGSASIKVTVVAVAPMFTVLDRPGRILSGARSVSLRVASSLPARLVVRGGARVVRRMIGSRARTVRVALRPEGGILRLALELRAGGQTRRTVVEIDR